MLRQSRETENTEDLPVSVQRKFLVNSDNLLEMFEEWSKEISETKMLKNLKKLLVADIFFSLSDIIFLGIMVPYLWREQTRKETLHKSESEM